MNPVAIQTAETISTWLSLIVSIGAVTSLFYALSKFMQKPNRTQDSRLDDLEEWRKEELQWRKSIEDRFKKSDTHLESVDDDTRVTQKALLALLAHAIDGNDIDSLKDAKHDLEQHLIDK